MLLKFGDIIRKESEGLGRILVAVSSGVDSMVMAELFASCPDSPGFAIAHCNFHLRSDESDADALAVEQWAASRGIPFFRADFDTEAYARANSVSIEMAARKLRYEWFSKICLEQGFGAVAVAHNSNDNAETLILNLLRGTGLKGIAGMSVRGPMPHSDGRIILFRPMLGFSRREIEDYALSNGISWREDSSNASSIYKRNRIRHGVFPQFEKINPSFLDTFASDMEHFRQAQEITDIWYSEKLKDCLLPDGSGLSLSALKEEPQRGFIIYRYIEPYGFHPGTASLLCSLMEEDGTFSGKRFLSPTHELLTVPSGIVLREIIPANVSAVSVNGCGEYAFGDVKFSVSVLHNDAGLSLKQPHGSIIFDSALLPFPFTLRRWQNGDWFCPLGMKGKKKLSDFFSDLKYGNVRKEQAAVAAFGNDGSHVAFILGERIDEKIKVTPETAEVTLITLV